MFAQHVVKRALERPCIYAMVDSSPQGGRNIVNSEYDYVLGEDLLELCSIFANMVSGMKTLRHRDPSVREVVGAMRHAGAG